MNGENYEFHVFCTPSGRHSCLVPDLNSDPDFSFVTLNYRRDTVSHPAYGDEADAVMSAVFPVQCFCENALIYCD